jgi:hypothetical protein
MFIFQDMHPTTRRLYAALAEYLGKKDVGSTLASQTLGLASAQTMNNWEDRGVSQAGIVKASSICRIRPAWIEREELPMFEPIKISEYDQPKPAQTLIASEVAPKNHLDNSVNVALNTLEKALVNLGMSGRERIAPMFESFARSPGEVIKNDIAMLLESPDAIKSTRIYTQA